ncbi:hypothetical protein C8R47DRAFT_1070433 [Mycena vitilis]|nr:hypothetical protein C8R47DRAFT_1070433 [Mycena vitilis]
MSNKYNSLNVYTILGGNSPGVAARVPFLSRAKEAPIMPIVIKSTNFTEAQAALGVQPILEHMVITTFLEVGSKCSGYDLLALLGFKQLGRINHKLWPVSQRVHDLNKNIPVLSCLKWEQIPTESACNLVFFVVHQDTLRP